MTQPGYGPFDRDGRRLPPPDTPPAAKRVLRWLVLGGAVVVSAVVIVLAVVLRPQHVTGSATAAASTSAVSPAPAPTSASRAGGAQVADQHTGGRARFDGSDQVALSWVRALVALDYRTAYGLSCAEVQRSATDAAAGGDPAQELGSYFFQKTLGGQWISAGTLDSIIYSSDAASDIASFTLQLENGEEFLLLVYVQGDGTVCDFV